MLRLSAAYCSQHLESFAHQNLSALGSSWMDSAFLLSSWAPCFDSHRFRLRYLVQQMIVFTDRKIECTLQCHPAPWSGSQKQQQLVKTTSSVISKAPHQYHLPPWLEHSRSFRSTLWETCLELFGRQILVTKNCVSFPSTNSSLQAPP